MGILATSSSDIVKGEPTRDDEREEDTEGMPSDHPGDGTVHDSTEGGGDNTTDVSGGGGGVGGDARLDDGIGIMNLCGGESKRCEVGFNGDDSGGVGGKIRFSGIGCEYFDGFCMEWREVCFLFLIFFKSEEACFGVDEVFISTCLVVW